MADAGLHSRDNPCSCTAHSRGYIWTPHENIWWVEHYQQGPCCWYWQWNKYGLSCTKNPPETHPILHTPSTYLWSPSICVGIVCFFHQRTKLKELQSQLQLPEYRLIQAVDTRWNSVLYILERLYEWQTVITALYLLGRNTLCLNEEEWSHISQAIAPSQEDCSSGHLKGPLKKFQQSIM